MIPFPALSSVRRLAWTRVTPYRLTIADLPRVVGIVAATVGTLVLLGWLFDVPLLKSVVPRAINMKPNAAVSFVLLGSGLAAIAWPGQGRRRRLVGRALCVAAAVIGLLTVLEYVTGHDLGIDQILFGGKLADQGGAPGRMAPLTAVCFSLLGVAAFGGSVGLGRRAIYALAGGAALISALNVVEFAFNAEAPAFLAGYTSMAVHTAITMGVLAVGVIGLLGAASPFAPLSGPSPTARLFRRLLAVSVVVPVAMAWARIEGQGLGLYGTSYGTSLMLVGTVAVIIVAILRAARWAQALELHRAASEVERDRFFDMSLDMLVVMGTDGRFCRINDAWMSTFGYAADEVVGHPWTEFIHPDDLERTIIEAQHNLVEGAPAVGFVNRYRHKDGTYRWLEWASRQAPDHAVAFAVARDVTGRKLDEDRKARQTRILEARNETLNDRAAHDPLTGLHNRRFFGTAVTRLERSWRRQTLAERPPISVILFDLDHFGEINKAHGHQAGDAVLRQFAAILRKRFRESDLVTRYGGEEFAAVLEGATAADAYRIAEGIRDALETCEIDIGTGTPLRLTVSAGCAQLGDLADVSAGLAVADVWLAQAKRSGRNQVIGLEADAGPASELLAV
jgi:diguanylate cyclase (GGDEF)-like protein/PAS domain S-box-containing protein